MTNKLLTGPYKFWNRTVQDMIAENNDSDFRYNIWYAIDEQLLERFLFEHENNCIFADQMASFYCFTNYIIIKFYDNEFQRFNGTVDIDMYGLIRDYLMDALKKNNSAMESEKVISLVGKFYIWNYLYR